MSTVVYKDGVMAFDSRMGLNDMIMHGVLKAGRTKKYLYGYAGRASHMTPLYDWVRECEAEKDMPSPEFFYRKNDSLISVGDVGTCMLISASGTIWEVTTEGHTIPIPRAFHAIGNGYEYAFGAMAMGASAVEAVEVASQYDAFTGGEIHSLNIDSIGDYPIRPSVKTS